MSYFPFTLVKEVYLKDRSINDLDSFNVHIMMNRQFQNAKVIVTDVMKQLYRQILSQKCLTIMLTGPHGVGKTTTLFWLFHQLQNEGAIAIPVNQQVINNIVAIPKLLLVDLNQIHTREACDIEALISLTNNVISSNGNIILAASASILASVYWADKKIRSPVRALYWSSQKIELKINRKTAELVVKEFFPSIREEEKKKLLDRANCLPGLIKFYQEEEYTEAMLSYIVQWWNDTYALVSEKDSIHTRCLFLALYFSRSITAMNLPKTVAVCLAPILCHLVYLDENLVPRMHLKLNSEAIEGIIVSLSRVIGAKSNVESAIGLVYELKALNILSFTEIDAIDESKSSNIHQLPQMHVMPARYEKEQHTSINFQELYQLGPQHPGIDGVCKLDSLNPGSTTLLILQISVKQANHTNKIQGVQKITGEVINMIRGCDEVIYLYINPKCSSDVGDLSPSFFPSIPWSLKEKKWYFALPTNKGKFVDAYSKLKLLMQP